MATCAKAAATSKRSWLRFQRTNVVTSNLSWLVYFFVCGLDRRQYYDLEDRGSANDILSTLGFVIAIRDTLRLVIHGLFFAGVPCFSFIWMNRSNTGRSAAAPLGNPDCPATKAITLFVESGRQYEYNVLLHYFTLTRDGSLRNMCLISLVLWFFLCCFY